MTFEQRKQELQALIEHLLGQDWDAFGTLKFVNGRRTYITRLANKGVGVRLLAALAGHSHISTTQRYIDVNSEQLSEAVELL
jgi:site-specific recombinase XerD